MSAVRAPGGRSFVVKDGCRLRLPGNVAPARRLATTIFECRKEPGLLRTPQASCIATWSSCPREHEDFIPGSRFTQAFGGRTEGKTSGHLSVRCPARSCVTGRSRAALVVERQHSASWLESRRRLAPIDQRTQSVDAKQKLASSGSRRSPLYVRRTGKHYNAGLRVRCMAKSCAIEVRAARTRQASSLISTSAFSSQNCIPISRNIVEAVVKCSRACSRLFVFL